MLDTPADRAAWEAYVATLELDYAAGCAALAAELARDEERHRGAWRAHAEALELDPSKLETPPEDPRNTP